MCVHADIALTSLSTVATLSTGVAVGIAMITGTIALVVGVLAGVLLHHCIIKYRSHSSKADSSSHQQQQAGPEHEEVPVDKKIELKIMLTFLPIFYSHELHLLFFSIILNYANWIPHICI